MFLFCNNTIYSIEVLFIENIYFSFLKVQNNLDKKICKKSIFYYDMRDFLNLIKKLFI